MKRSTAELKAIVLARGSHLMDLHGVKAGGGCRVLADVGDVTRFVDRNRFASACSAGRGPTPSPPWLSRSSRSARAAMPGTATPAVPRPGGPPPPPPAHAARARACPAPATTANTAPRRVSRVLGCRHRTDPGEDSCIHPRRAPDRRRHGVPDRSLFRPRPLAVVHGGGAERHLGASQSSRRWSPPATLLRTALGADGTFERYEGEPCPYSAITPRSFILRRPTPAAGTPPRTTVCRRSSNARPMTSRWSSTGTRSSGISTTTAPWALLTFSAV